MNEDIYKIVKWPEIQEYMDEEGFEENCCLINDSNFVNVYGNNAYFCNMKWIEQINKTIK